MNIKSKKIRVENFRYVTIEVALTHNQSVFHITLTLMYEVYTRYKDTATLSS